MAFKDAKRCKAKSKRTGQPCRNPARLERAVCRHHGGNTPAGFSSPHFKTGKHSKYLKTSSRSRQAATDKERIFNTVCNLNEEIALTIMHTQELLPLIDDRNPNRAKVWENIHQVIEYQRKLTLTQSTLRLQQLELEKKLNTLVPVEEFRRFALTLGKLFGMSPEPIKLEQLAALQREYSILPKVIRQADLTDSPAGEKAAGEKTSSVDDYLFNQTRSVVPDQQKESSKHQAACNFQSKETNRDQSPPAQIRQTVPEMEQPPILAQTTGEQVNQPGAGEIMGNQIRTPDSDLFDRELYLDEDFYKELKEAGAFD